MNLSDRSKANSATSNGRDAHALIEPLRAMVDRVIPKAVSTLGLVTIGRFEHEGREFTIPRLRIAGPYAGHDPIRLGLFAGIHGDEPAGCSALVDLAAAVTRDLSLAAGYELYIYPLINPTGYERGVRLNHQGVDLNRMFWCGSPETEVWAIEKELREHQFHGIITLHADDTCEGVYGYAHGRTLDEALLGPALAAAKKFLPIDERGVIDGFPARAGLICDCFSGVLSAPPEQTPKPFDVIFETPACAPFDAQVSATVAALKAILVTYPGFIAYAQGL
jgi:protein MpaA